MVNSEASHAQISEAKMFFPGQPEIHHAGTMENPWKTHGKPVEKHVFLELMIVFELRLGKFRTGTAGYGFVSCDLMTEFFGRAWGGIPVGK